MEGFKSPIENSLPARRWKRLTMPKAANKRLGKAVFMISETNVMRNHATRPALGVSDRGPYSTTPDHREEGFSLKSHQTTLILR